MRVDRGAEFGAQAAQIFEHGGAMVFEVVDLVVDLAAAAQALLDGLGGLGRGFLAGAASVVVGVGAEHLGVGLGLRAQPGAVLLALAFEFLGLLLGGQQDVRGRLADELELARDRDLTDVLRRVGFEPVDELLEELVDLVLVVAAADDGEVGRPQPCDVVPIQVRGA